MRSGSALIWINKFHGSPPRSGRTLAGPQVPVTRGPARAGARRFTGGQFEGLGVLVALLRRRRVGRLFCIRLQHASRTFAPRPCKWCQLAARLRPGLVRPIQAGGQVAGRPGARLQAGAGGCARVVAKRGP